MPLDLQLRLPFGFIMIASALWTLLITYWQPHWIDQTRSKRLKSSVSEGLICGGLWGLFVYTFDQLNIFSSIMNGFLASILWAGVAYYSRKRYQDIIDEAN
jgi:hypothetical protein